MKQSNFDRDVDRIVNRIWDQKEFLSRKSLRGASYGTFRATIHELRGLLDELEAALDSEKKFDDDDPMAKYFSDIRVKNEDYFGDIHIPSNQKAGKQG